MRRKLYITMILCFLCCMSGCYTSKENTENKKEVKTEKIKISDISLQLPEDMIVVEKEGKTILPFTPETDMLEKGSVFVQWSKDTAWEILEIKKKEQEIIMETKKDKISNLYQ